MNPITEQVPWPADKRLHHASDAYLQQSEDPRGLWEKRIAHAARLRFNAMRQIVWWNDIFPDLDAVRRGGNWELLDFFIKEAVGHGLKLLFSVELRPKATQTWAIREEDRCRDKKGKVDLNWDGTTRHSYASPRFGYALEFLRRAAVRAAGRDRSLPPDSGLRQPRRSARPERRAPGQPAGRSRSRGSATAGHSADGLASLTANVRTRGAGFITYGRAD